MGNERNDMNKTCHELADQLSACLDGELEGECLEEILTHLEECDCCKQCADEIKATRDLIGKLPPPQMPEDMKQRLKACLKKESDE